MLPVAVVERIVRVALPRSRVIDVQPFADGLRNANFKIQLDSTPKLAVLRIYEHDASLCQKEIDLIRLIRGSVPVPEVIHAEPRGWEEIPPFALLRFIEGMSFRDLKQSGDRNAIAQAAHSAGETLAAIGRTTFSKPGWLAPGPSVSAALLEGADPLPRIVDSYLASRNLQKRVPGSLRDRIHTLIWSYAPQVSQLGEESRLVHGDFGKRNLLVRSVAGRWTVVAVLDWEFAISGPTLADVGHFLCYERASRPVVEPNFSEGYLRAGGKLSQNWRQLARIVDLAALCESLTHDHLPDSVVSELAELIRATVEDRDAQF